MFAIDSETMDYWPGDLKGRIWQDRIHEAHIALTEACFDHFAEMHTLIEVNIIYGYKKNRVRDE